MTGIPGEKALYGGKGVTTCATCDGAFYRKMEVAVLGKATSASRRSASSSRVSPARFISFTVATACAPEDHVPTAPSPTKKSRWPGTTFPSRCSACPEGSVSGLKVKNVKTGAESVLPVKGIFVAIGHIPNTGPFTPALDVDEGSYFKPVSSPPNGQTRVPGVYVMQAIAPITFIARRSPPPAWVVRQPSRPSAGSAEHEG